MDPMTMGMIGGGVSSAAGIYSANKNYKAQQEANAANIQMAREQMAFQERMSSTAHQRESKDLEAAGLNRILSATGGSGAPSGSGASATVQAPLDRTSDILRDSVNSGMSLASLHTDLQAKDAQIAGQLAQTMNTLEQNKVIEETGKGLRLSNAKQAGTLDSEIAAQKHKEKLAASEAARMHHEARRSSTAYTKEAADLPRAVQQSDYDRTFAPVDNTIRRVGDALDAVTSAINVGKILKPKPLSDRELKAKEYENLIKAGAMGVKARKGK